MPPIRLLPFAAASGPLNMARDEALLLSAADRGVASLRFYTWTEPTVSLGYFQPAGERDQPTPPGPPSLGGKGGDRGSSAFSPPLPPGEGAGGWGSLSFVRRATGGAAIVHDPPTEITYALALPPGPHWQPPGESWICRMHYFVRDVLRAKWGVTAKAVVCGEERKLGPVLCFLHQTAGDLVVAHETPPPGPLPEPERGRKDTSSSPSPVRGGGRGVGSSTSKIAGSAQRKWKGALLQHGSILLSRSPFAPQLLGVADLTGVTIDRRHLAAAVVDHFATQTGWAVEPGDWTADELALADRTAADKYASADWNEKR